MREIKYQINGKLEIIVLYLKNVKKELIKMVKIEEDWRRITNDERLNVSRCANQWRRFFNRELRNMPRHFIIFVLMYDWLYFLHVVNRTSASISKSRNGWTGWQGNLEQTLSTSLWNVELFQTDWTYIPGVSGSPRKLRDILRIFS